MNTLDISLIDELLSINAQQAAAIERQAAVIAAFQARIEELEAELVRLQKDPPQGPTRTVPSFVKPNRPPKEEKQRKKRDHPHFRIASAVATTETVVHAVDNCPDCGHRLSGGWVHGRRQVIEIPNTPIRVIEHQKLARWCGVCQKRVVAKPDLSREGVGNSVFGVGLMSLIGYMKTVARMPVRTIRQWLQAVYALDMGTGEISEISEILHLLAQEGEEHYAALGRRLRRSKHVHGDETGWREDGENGENGYLWSFSTPDTRYFTRDNSRGHQVAEGVLGSDYQGILVSDFYGGYNYHLGLHQGCWTHLLRDLHALKDEYPDDASVRAWAEAVKQVYLDARAFTTKFTEQTTNEDRRRRIQMRERCQEQLVALGEPYACTDARQRKLAQRIVRFSNELFTFVEHAEVASENNAAERAIRPAVIDRKVPGGTRSGKGSRTKATLMSLFRTWEARGMDRNLPHDVDARDCTWLTKFALTQPERLPAVRRLDCPVAVMYDLQPP